MRTKAIKKVQLASAISALSIRDMEKIQNLVSKLSVKKKKKSADDLVGIWKGLGFENIHSLENDILSIRKDMTQSIIDKYND